LPGPFGNEIGMTGNTRRALFRQSWTERKLWRWIIPIGGGLLAAILIVIATPHVPWFLRVALAVIAFLYISGQSAAYLWPSQADQGT
jgi:hypothetical protein